MAEHLRLDSEDEGETAVDIMASFRAAGSRPSRASPAVRNGTPQKTSLSPVRSTPARPSKKASVSPGMFISDASSADEEEDVPPPAPTTTRTVSAKRVQVRVPPVTDPELYKPYPLPEETVDSIVKESSRRGELIYDIKLTNGQRKKVC
jgi:hypothetical protein